MTRETWNITWWWTAQAHFLWYFCAAKLDLRWQIFRLLQWHLRRARLFLRGEPNVRQCTSIRWCRSWARNVIWLLHLSWGRKWLVHSNHVEPSIKCKPLRIVQRFMQTPSSMTTPGPMVTFGPIWQSLPIFAVGSIKTLPMTPWSPWRSWEGDFCLKEAK